MRFESDTAANLTMPAGKSDHIEWDDDLPGFGVRIRSSGSKTWLIQTRIARQGYRESLGDVRKVTLKDARMIARKRFAQIELGMNPRADEAARATTAETKKQTLAIVSADYLAARAAGLNNKPPMRASTLKAARRYFEVQWAPLRGKPITDIKKEDVAKQLREIVNNHGRTSAARARTHLSALFTWAMKEAYPVEANPVLNTHSPVNSDDLRDRVLDDEELKTVWRACRDDDFGRIVRLLMFTACRRDEIGSLSWSEVDIDGGRITIAGERTKNGRVHKLKLPPAAVDILQSIPRRPARDLVFGGRGGGFSAWSYSTLHLHARIAEQEGAALKPWTLHDIRRTVRTAMSKLGIVPHVAEAVLNHVAKKTKVERTYDHYDYDKEKGEALAKWADHLLSIVQAPASNVVSLKSA